MNDRKRGRGPSKNPDPRRLRPYKCRRCGNTEARLIRGGRWRDCGKCAAARNRANYQRDRDAISAKRKRWWASLPMEERSNRRRKAGLRYRYKISVGEFERMMTSQGGKCVICRRPPGSNKPLFVDHCHTDGHVRGLLCGACNSGIAYLRDNPTLIRKAAEYVESRSLAALRALGVEVTA